ncbi:MAG: hypothetical protein QXT45_04280 [Candidatus Bilamarchaeaceae archaeon]
MSDESVTQQSNSSAESIESTESSKDSVSYDTYRRAIGEIKSLKAKLNELMEERNRQEAQRLAEQGQWKERAELLEKQLVEKDDRLKNVVSTFAKKIFHEAARQAAVNVGVRRDAIDDVIKVTDFTDIEVADDFSVDRQAIENKFRELAKTKPWFFEKPKATISPPLPTSGSYEPPPIKLESLSWDQLKDLARQVEN